jgi:glycosyltransferase involved in cell wall biosynthesis
MIEITDLWEGIVNNEWIIPVGIAVLALITGLCSMLCSHRYGVPGRRAKRVLPNSSHEPVSVVITAHNKSTELERNLPHILSQEYPDYEVIVVDEASTDETIEVLTRLEKRFDNLTHTFVPKTSYFINRKQPAITLGVKAAHHEWVVFTEADCHPDSNKWLESLTRHFSDSVSLVIGYANYEHSNLYNRFIHLFYAMFAMPHAEKHVAQRATLANLAVRRSHFLHTTNLFGSRNLLSGEGDIIVNKLSNGKNTAVAYHPDTLVHRDNYDRKEELFYMETRRHLRKHHYPRLRYNLHQTFQWLERITLWALILVTALIPEIPGIPEDYRLIVSGSLLAWHLIVQSYKMYCFHLTSSLFKEPGYYLSLDLFEALEPLRKGILMIRHKMNRKLFKRYRLLTVTPLESSRP